MWKSLTSGLLACIGSAALAATSSSVTLNSGFSGYIADPHSARVDNSGTHHAGSAEASAWASYGVLKTDATALMTFYTGPNNFNSTYSSRALSAASFQDGLVVGGGAPGSQGSMTLGIQVAGQLDAAATAHPSSLGAASWELRVNLGGQVSSIHHDLARYGDGSGWNTSGGHVGASPYATHWFTVPIVFGQNLSVDVRLSSVAAATAHAGASDSFAGGWVELGHSVRWAGISAVRLADDTPLTAFSVTSSSGTDYVPSMVPEPATGPLWLTGAMLLWFARRRAPGDRDPVGRPSGAGL